MKARGDARGQSLVAAFERAGCDFVDTAILQPAEAFLDLSGEDIRARMYLTTDAGGRDYCLRPDFTIPVCQQYLASPQAGGARSYCYRGPIFRDRDGRPAEILQAGVESFGRADIAAADAEMLALALEAAAHYGVRAPQIRMGDAGIFAALVAALDLAPAWKRRLIKDFSRKSGLAEELRRLAPDAANQRSEYQGVLTALAGSDPKAAHALVTDLLSIAGITAVGGRSVGEIADRFLEQSALGAAQTLPDEARALVQRFLGIAGDPDEAVRQLRALAADAGLALAPAIDLFESRTGFLAARGVDIRQIQFATAFGRGIDYYTGFVFELHDPQTRVSGPLAAGGRYDGLLTRLGASAQIPAVGFAVWLERLAACGEMS